MKSAQKERLRSVARTVLRGSLGQRLPKVDGDATLEGLVGDVIIRRDRLGIPTIEAKNEQDLFFGVGVCHAQDRGFQLEILLRTVRGTLAEMVGKDGITVDRLSRRIGFHRAARAQVPVLRPDVRAQIEAYAKGISAAIESGLAPRPHELMLIGAKASTWTAYDVQAVSTLLCFALAANWDVELLRLEILESDGVDAMLSVDAPYPADLDVTVQAGRTFGDAAAHLRRDVEALRSVSPLGGASNAWALSPSKSTTGRPILAADSHLPPDVPVHWYLFHGVAPAVRTTGACFVGIPGIAIGHSERCAWGVMAAHADNTDLFIEEIGPDGASVRAADGSFLPCEVLEERIEVKGGAPIIERVLSTPRGPIVSPIFAGARSALSMSATWLAARPYTGLFRAHVAKNVAELHELFRDASCSSVNVVMADVDGAIAHRLSVEVPIRHGGHGTLPRPGWLADSGWAPSPLPFERMPSTTNPSIGFVANANNAPVPLDGDDAFFWVDFLDGFRHRAITDALSAKDGWSLEDAGALQKDVRSIPWERAKSRVLAARSDADVALAVELLAGWDGQMKSDSPAASIWALASSSLISGAVHRCAPNTAGRALGAGFHDALPATTLATRRLSWLVREIEKGDGSVFGDVDSAIARALGDAVRRLRGRFGSDPAAWAWGTVRPLHLRHALGKTVPALDVPFGLGPFPFQGDASTIAQGTVDLADPLRDPIGVANLRARIDVGAFENSRFALLAGQSGNPLSPHFADQYEAFVGDGIRIAWTDAEARQTAVHTLTIAPRR